MSCSNAYDSITQSAGTPLGNHYDYTDSGHVVTSYCRVTGGTWVAWINAINGANLDDGTGDQTKADWPSQIASMTPVGVGYFPDDGSGPIVYGLGIEPCYIWDAGGFYSGRDPCALWPTSGDKYSNNAQSILAGWFSGLLDVQVRTDGATVWVVALARESVKYPFLYNSPTEIDACGLTHPTFSQDWDSGDSDAFAHDTSSGNRFWYYFASGGDKPYGNYDDPGPGNSFRWQPARVTVWAGDIGGFTSLGTVEAKFNNYDTGLIGGIECAASPAEPGVLHVLWAEAGDFGVQTVQPQRGQRINYTRWSAAGNTLNTDLVYAAENGSGTISDANWNWTAEYILRNDHGSPIAIVWPGHHVGGTYAPSTQPQLWDLSAGTISVLQTLDATLVPTVAEAGITNVEQVAGFFDSAHNLDPFTGVIPRRSQFASSLYTDPTLNNQNVYLICSRYSATGIVTANVAVAFYRIPCDGSAGFSYLDATREVMFSIVPGGTFLDTADESLFASDFISDTDNVWMPSLTKERVGGTVLQLDRQCKRGWLLLPSFPVPDPVTGFENGQWAIGPSPPALVNDGSNEWIYGGGTGPTLTTQNSSPTNIAALKAKICRCCQPCNRTGMHVWEIL